MLPRYSETEAREAIAASLSYTEALRRLGMRTAGGNHRTLSTYAEEIWLIPVDHFYPAAARRAPLRREPIPLEQVLVTGSTYSRGLLKARLYATGLKERQCELCGQGEAWRGRRMALILDHINGVATDNRLENLQIVCPNCAATLDTHCGKNVHVARLCARCATPFEPRDRAQRHCSHSCGSHSEANHLAQVAARRVERPPYARLLEEIAAAGYSAVGRRYGVSDNASRKCWVRQYEREAGSGGLRRPPASDAGCCGSRGGSSYHIGPFPGRLLSESLH